MGGNGERMRRVEEREEERMSWGGTEKAERGYKGRGVERRKEERRREG